ncbi:MAG: DUF502 domain-containing protein [candidate division WOR-3 bacterium]|jgi:uncharacterized membrane protein
MMLARLRNYFITGLATILPLGLTIFVIWFIIAHLGNLLGPLLRYGHWLKRLPSAVLTILGFLILLTVITVIGALTRGYLGRHLFTWLDRFFRQLPLAGGIYTSARQFTDAVFIKRSSLRKTVLVEYPRRGMFALGFLTSEEPLQLADGRPALLIFFPTAPNPTSGWLAIVPAQDVTVTSLSIEEGLKFVVSGGLAQPGSPVLFPPKPPEALG